MKPPRGKKTELGWWDIANHLARGMSLSWQPLYEPSELSIAEGDDALDFGFYVFKPQPELQD